MRTIPAPLGRVALETPALAMPGDTLPAGSTRDLRRAMARFCDGDAHLAARTSVEAAIAGVDRARLESATRQRTRALLAHDRGDEVSVLVPASAMAETLGIIDAHDDGAALIERLVRVGEAIVAGTFLVEGALTDQTAAELLAMSEDAGEPVAIISILHQTRGATGALIEATLDSVVPRPVAVPSTKRTAVSGLELDSFGDIAAGETVAVELDQATEFGHGPHACPGRELAEMIVAVVVETLADEAPSG